MNLKTTIITSPNESLWLEKEIRLLKSGLLYSDSITLVSPSLTSVLHLLKLSSLTEKEKVEFIKGLTKFNPDLKGEEIENAIKLKNKLTNKKGKTKEEIVKLEQIKKILKNTDKYIEQWGENVFFESGLGEFYHLIENKTIELKHLDVNETHKDMGMQILEETSEILNSENSYPIFDDLIEKIAKFYIEEASGEYDSQNLNEIFVGKEFLLRLPNIDNLNFNDIIKAKEELGIELNRFKNLINNYSQEISGLAFDTSNKLIIEKKYNYDFVPQLKEIQDEIERNSFFKHLKKNIGENLVKYSIFLGVSGVDDIKKLLLGAGGMTVVETIIKAINESKNLKTDIKNSSVYFYHKLMNK